MGKKKKRNAQTPQNLSPNSQPIRKFYRHDEHLGSETRVTEFKEGPFFIQHGFKDSVAKYVCGFLNSQENGKLLIGVNDAGHVCGYNCNHQQEDRLRLDVDEAIKDLFPSIFPEDYSVNFVPVCNEHGHPIGISKVIEIIVHRQGATMDQLYRARQAVFMRRDGSIQELRVSEIQEWLHRRYQNELKKMEEKLSQKQSELDRKELDVQRQQSAMGHVAEENRLLKDEVSHLKQINQQNGTQDGDEIVERLAKMEQILKDQGTRINKKKSNVCVIS